MAFASCCVSAKLQLIPTEGDFLPFLRWQEGNLLRNFELLRLVEQRRREQVYLSGVESYFTTLERLDTEQSHVIQECDLFELLQAWETTG